MATLVINCDGSSSSFEKNGNIRITYELGPGTVTISKIEGMRTDSYTSYEDAAQTCTITIGTTKKTVQCGRVRFNANSSYASWNITAVTWTGLSGSQYFQLGGLTHYSGAAYYNKTFSANSAFVVPAASLPIYYNANGGSGAPATQTKTVGTALTLSSTTPTRSGFIFKGWSELPRATSATYSAGGSYTTDASTTMFAVWEELPRVKVKSGSSWVTGTMEYKSGSSWIPASTIKLKMNGDF